MSESVLPMFSSVLRRISMVCLALELAGSWVELGFSVDMKAFGWAFIY